VKFSANVNVRNFTHTKLIKDERKDKEKGELQLNRI
jgi:hypothetical protein